MLCARSENTLIGATNDENGLINVVSDFLPNEADGSIPEMAKRFKARDQPWMIVTDVRLSLLHSPAVLCRKLAYRLILPFSPKHNYGEGSAREHASLQPRFLNCKLILA